MSEQEANKFRVTFSDGPLGNWSKSIDICAVSSEHAFEQAYRMPEAKSEVYTDIDVQEITEGPKVIGVKFEYVDTAMKRSFSDYIFIRANSEEEAVEFYNKNYKGGRFWFKASETAPDGKCIRGDVIATYYAACPGYDADATISHEGTHQTF